MLRKNWRNFWYLEVPKEVERETFQGLEYPALDLNHDVLYIHAYLRTELIFWADSSYISFGLAIQTCNKISGKVLETANAEKCTCQKTIPQEVEWLPFPLCTYVAQICRLFLSEAGKRETCFGFRTWGFLVWGGSHIFSQT